MRFFNKAAMVEEEVRSFVQLHNPTTYKYLVTFLKNVDEAQHHFVLGFDERGPGAPAEGRVGSEECRSAPHPAEHKSDALIIGLADICLMVRKKAYRNGSDAPSQLEAAPVTIQGVLIMLYGMRIRRKVSS